MATDTLSGIGSIEYAIDGGAWTPGSGISVGSNSLTFALPTVSVAGTHTIDYVVADRAGNEEATRTVTFHVQRTPAFTLAAKTVFMTNKTNPTAVSIATYLLDGTTPVAGRAVIMEISTNSYVRRSRAGSLRSRTRGAGSRSRLTKITSRTYIRYRFVGDDNYNAVNSKTVVYVPKVSLSTPSAGYTSVPAVPSR